MDTEPKSEGTPPPYGKFHNFFLTLPLIEVILGKLI